MAAVQVDRAQSDAMNLQVLKRQDSDVMEIIDTASHVVMYEFDQDNQSWKRKEVEGCLFVVKRFSTPRFQVCVNNRLSTTNMTLAIDEHLQVSSVDSFLILRCPDAAYASGYAIYGVWFFPEEDREKILNLLTRVVQSLKEPTAAVAAAPEPANSKEPQPQQSKAAAVAEPQQQQQQQTSRTRSRSRSKRNGEASNGRRQSGSATPQQQTTATTPTTILQRSPKNATKAGLPPTGASAPVQASESQQMQQEQAPNNSGMRAISREDGIAAGVAILGMISHNRSPSPSQQQQSQRVAPSPRGGRGRSQQKKQQQAAAATDATGAATNLLVPTTVSTATANGESPATPVNKEQLKQTLIALLDDASFFDQIYHAYVDRVHLRS